MHWLLNERALVNIPRADPDANPNLSLLPPPPEVKSFTDIPPWSLSTLLGMWQKVKEDKARQD